MADPSMLTVFPSEMVALSRDVGAVPDDQMDPSVQFPLATEVRLPGADVALFPLRNPDGGPPSLLAVTRK